MTTDVATIFQVLVKSPIGLTTLIFGAVFFNKGLKLSVWLTIICSLALAILAGMVASAFI
jgi:ribose/xylose/arabinose/galactoside ABC-type transport system permease subunit